MFVHVDAEVTTDGTWSGVLWLSGTEHTAASGNDILTLPDHSNDWTRGKEGGEILEKWLRGKIRVVTLGLLLSWNNHLQTNELEALLLLEESNKWDKE